MDQRIIITAVFLAFFIIPLSILSASIIAGLELLGEYAREHVLLCLIPAFLIAGAIAAFINRGAIMRILGSKAKPALAYGVASVSGAIMTVCSCTVLPLFAGIRTRGAGLGPAITFLYAGPAINIPAILLTFNVLGLGLGVARVTFAIAFSVIIGLVMAYLYRETVSDKKVHLDDAQTDLPSRPVLALLLIALLGVLVASTLSIEPMLKIGIIAVLIASIVGIAFSLTKTQRSAWSRESWDVVLLVAPYLFIGVFIAGVIGAIVPDALIERFVGTNSIVSVVSASLFASLMYFSTLTEIPIIQAFLIKGMAQGPALTMLLAGPSLSLPNLLVISKILGWRKTLTYAGSVIVLSSLAGFVYGAIA